MLIERTVFPWSIISDRLKPDKTGYKTAVREYGKLLRAAKSSCFRMMLKWNLRSGVGMFHNLVARLMYR